MTCPECEHRYSDDASYCPGCGRPNPAWEPRRSTPVRAARAVIRETPAPESPLPRLDPPGAERPALAAAAGDPDAWAWTVPQPGRGSAAHREWPWLLLMVLIPLTLCALYVVFVVLSGIEC